MLRPLKLKNNEEKESKGVFKWVLTRWYFWVIFVIKTIIDFNSNLSENGLYSITSGLLASFFTIFIPFILFRGIFFGFGTIIKKLKNRK
jgi:uncharacterized membrane protein (DUF485 family)